MFYQIGVLINFAKFTGKISVAMNEACNFIKNGL